MLCAINRRISSMFVLSLKSWINIAFTIKHKEPASSESGQLVSSTYWYVPWRFEYSLQLLERRDQLFQITVCMAHIERSHHDFATRSAYCSCKQCFCLYNTFCVAKMLVGGVPQTPLICIFQCRLRLPAGCFWRCQSSHPTKKPAPFWRKVNGRIWWFMVQ